MKFYIFTIFLLAVNLTPLSSTSLEGLNSASLSQIRFNVRNIDEPVKQCNAYCEGILSLIDRATDQSNTQLLDQVIDVLSNRKTAYGPNSLAAFTTNCIKILEGQSGDYSPSAEVAFQNAPQDGIVSNLEKENRDLREQLNGMKSKFDELSNKIQQSENEKQELTRKVESLNDRLKVEAQRDRDQCIDFLNKANEARSGCENEKQELARKIETLNDRVVSSEKTVEICKHELESRPDTNSQLQLHKDIERLKVEAQRDRDQCIEFLNKANEARSQCEYDLKQTSTSLKSQNTMLVDQKKTLEEDVRKLNRELNECKATARKQENDELEGCRRELATLRGYQRNGPYGQASDWGESGQMREAAMNIRSLYQKTKGERDECYEGLNYFKMKADNFDRMTESVQKYIQRGYDLYCSRWKIFTSDGPYYVDDDEYD